MKTIITLCLVCFFTQTLSAQSQKKTLYGSFVLENQVFQYQYKRDVNIHTLKLSTLAKPDPTSGLDDNKLDRTLKFLREAADTNNTKKFYADATKGIIDTISLLPSYLDELKSLKNKKATWETHYENIDKLINIFEKYKIETVMLADTTAKDIYSATELLHQYKSFLQNAAEPQSTREIPFPELKLDEFKAVFVQQLSQLYLAKNKDLTGALLDKANTKAVDIMYEIKARADFQNDEPVTAFLNLKRKYIDIDFEVPVAKKSPEEPTDSTVIVKVPFEVTNIIVEFEDGTIKNIFADLHPQVQEYINVYGSSTIRFRNNKPISISGKFDPDIFTEHKIFAGNTRELMNTLFEESKRQKPNLTFVKEDFLKNKSYGDAYFRLSNLLDYKVVSETDNEDYSPANSKIEISEPNALVELKKEKRSKIITARAYTDFQGLTNDQPNGLVQIEVSRKVNFLTGRRQGILGIAKGNRKGIYTGGFTYIEPKFTLSKIEENNRYLNLDSSSLDKTKSMGDSSNYFQLNPLEVLRYQQWSFGIDINIFKLNLHNRKSNFQINGNFNFGRTSAVDSIKIANEKITYVASQNISRISTTTYGLGIMYEVKPDSRYGLSFGYDWRWMDVLNTRFEYNPNFSNQYRTAWFNGFIKVNDDSKLFWRFRKNWLKEKSRHNYYQIQLGYELDIFKATN